MSDHHCRERLCAVVFMLFDSPNVLPHFANLALSVNSPFTAGPALAIPKVPSKEEGRPKGITVNANVASSTSSISTLRHAYLTASEATC